MTKSRFRVKSDRRVYDGDRYMCTANTIMDAKRIVTALTLVSQPAPKNLPPSPSAEDGTPEIPNGYTRVVMDYRTQNLELKTSRAQLGLPSFYGVGALFASTSLSPPMTQALSADRNGPHDVAALGLLRKFVQRGKTT